MKFRLGFMASHGGSNMQAIINSYKIGFIRSVPSLVISNNSESGALQRAKFEGIPNCHISSIQYPDSDDLDNAIVDKLKEHKIDLVILAGYMKRLGPQLIFNYKNRILNIHPALLPKFGGKGMYGMNVHRAVIQAVEKESGCSVHIVDEEYDHGKVLGTKSVPIYPGDSPEDLASRVLAQEHILYSEVIRNIEEGLIALP